MKFSRWILNLVKKSFLVYSLDLIPFLPCLGNSCKFAPENVLSLLFTSKEILGERKKQQFCCFGGMV